MAVLCKFSRVSRHLLFKHNAIWEENIARTFRTVVQEPKPTRGIFKTCLISAVVGSAIGAGYAFQKVDRDRKHLEMEGQEIATEILKYKPLVPPSRKVFIIIPEFYGLYLCSSRNDTELFAGF